MKKYLNQREILKSISIFPRTICHAILRNIRNIKIVSDPEYYCEPLIQMPWYNSPEGLHYWHEVIRALVHNTEVPQPPLIERYLYRTVYTAQDAKGTLYQEYEIASETFYREEIIRRIENLHGNVSVVLHKTFPIYERLSDLRRHPAAKYDESVIATGWYLDSPFGRLFLVSRGFGQDTEDSLYLEFASGKLKLLALTSSPMMPPSNGKRYISEGEFQKILNKYLP